MPAIPAAYFEEAAAALGQDVGNHDVIAQFTINDEDFYALLLFWWCDREERPSFPPIEDWDNC